MGKQLAAGRRQVTFFQTGTSTQIKAAPAKLRVRDGLPIPSKEDDGDEVYTYSAAKGAVADATTWQWTFGHFSGIVVQSIGSSLKGFPT